MSFPCDMRAVVSCDGQVTYYPNYLLMSIDEIHESLQKTNYRHGFPGMNGRSWSRLFTSGVHNIYDLVKKYITLKDRERFIEWMEQMGTNEDDAFECYRALDWKFRNIE